MAQSRYFRRFKCPVNEIACFVIIFGVGRGNLAVDTDTEVGSSLPGMDYW